MRILMIQPNYHAGGAEIAGNWPPGWAAYVGGAIRHGGFPDVEFLDAMAFRIEHDPLREIVRKKRPDVVLATAITPMIYKAQKRSRSPRKLAPGVITILGGIHPTFMYGQVLSEAPWIDYIVRGEGEEIIVNLLRSIEAGTIEADRGSIKGLAYLEDGKLIATPAHPVIADLDTLTPDWSLLEVGQVHLRPAERAGRGAELRARLPVHVPLLLAVEVLAQVPHARSEEVRRRDRDARARLQGRFLHSGRRRADDPPQEVRRLLRGDDRAGHQGSLGHQHARHRYPARRGSVAALSPGRAAAYLARHRSCSADEARPVPQADDDRAEQEGDQADPRRGNRRRSAVHHGARRRDEGDDRGDLPARARLGRRHGELEHVHAVAFRRALRGLGRSRRSSRLLEVQLRHADHEARRDRARRRAQGRAQELRALLLRQGVLQVSRSSRTASSASYMLGLSAARS